MSFSKIFKNEFKNIFSDAEILLTIFVGVVLYSFLYPQPYTNQSVSEFDIAVVDLDRSELSRKMTFMLDATAQIRVINADISEQEAKSEVIRGKIKGFVIIPKHFKRDIYLQKQPTIAIGADGSYFLIYGAIAEGAVKTILTESAKVKISKLLVEEEGIYSAMKYYTPFKTDIINLFNPQNSYLFYVIPAVFIVILQQTLLIGMGVLGGGYNERYKSYTILDDAPIWALMLSRILIFGIIYFVHFLYFYGFVFEFFGIPHIAHISDLLTFVLPFLLSTMMLGILVGSLFNSRELATPVILFTSLPIVFSGGFIWPIEALPEWVFWFSKLSPSTPAMLGFLQLNQMGADFEQVTPHYMHLWGLVVIYGMLAFLTLRYKQQRIQST